MSDVGEMWGEERDAYKKRRDNRVARRTRSMEWLKSLGHRVDFLTPYQARVDDTLDLYLSNGRYHNVKTGQRGEFKNIKSLIERELR